MERLLLSPSGQLSGVPGLRVPGSETVTQMVSNPHPTRDAKTPAQPHPGDSGGWGACILPAAPQCDVGPTLCLGITCVLILKKAGAWLLLRPNESGASTSKVGIRISECAVQFENPKVYREGHR